MKTLALVSVVIVLVVCGLVARWEASRPVKTLSLTRSLSVDGLQLGMSRPEAQNRLSHQPNQVEVANELRYGISLRWQWRAIFSDTGRVDELSGSSLQADGATVLEIGDSEKKAVGLLGPPSRWFVETSNTHSGYWSARGVYILFHSDWSKPSWMRPSQVDLITIEQPR